MEPRRRNGSSKSYGQYCAVAHSLDVLGERWTLLVVRDLLMGSKRYTDLREALPGIATDILTARLRTLEKAGLVRRRQLPRPAPATVYELTDSGHELAPAIIALGQVGLAMLDAPKATENIRPERMAQSLRLSFRPEASSKLDGVYELNIDEEPFVVAIANGTLDIAPGVADNPAMSLTTDALTLVGLLRGEITSADALADRRVELDGGRPKLERFIEAFAYPTRIPNGNVSSPATARRALTNVAGN